MFTNKKNLHKYSNDDVFRYKGAKNTFREMEIITKHQAGNRNLLKKKKNYGRYNNFFSSLQEETKMSSSKRKLRVRKTE